MEGSRSTHRRVGKYKMLVRRPREIDWDGVDWTHLAQDREQGRLL